MPNLYLNSPEGVSQEGRRDMLDRLRELHELQLEKPETRNLETRIAQYEMGFDAKFYSRRDCAGPGTRIHLRALWGGSPNPGHLRRQLPARPKVGGENA